jgi:hypothetical protein
MTLQTIAQELIQAADARRTPRFTIRPLIKIGRTETLAIVYYDREST